MNQFLSFYQPFSWCIFLFWLVTFMTSFYSGYMHYFGIANILSDFEVDWKPWWNMTKDKCNFQQRENTLYIQNTNIHMYKCTYYKQNDSKYDGMLCEAD